MSAEDTFEELALLVRSRYALVVLETREPDRAEAGLARIAFDLNLPYATWSRSRGLRRGDHPGDPAIEQTEEPAKALARALKDGAGLYHFRELGPHLDDPVVVSHLLDVVALFNNRRGALVLTGHDMRLPDALRAHATVLALPSPSFDDYRRLLERVIREYSAKMPVRVEISSADRLRLTNNLAGLSMLEAEKVITKIIVQDGVLSAQDVERVILAKRQLVEQDGLLEYYPVDNRASHHTVAAE